jgi:dihydrodipicolinate synthase
MREDTIGNVITAMITPFKNDDVDYEALDNIIYTNVKNNIDILVCGTTAETTTLTDKEYEQIIEYVVKKVDKKVFVMAGCGSNNTKKAIENAKLCEKIGVDSLLVVTPYYNKTSNEGLYQHFKAIANSTNLPMYLYNVPSRTGIDITSEIIIKLSEISNIVGIKDASGNIVKAQDIISKVDENFAVYAGCDDIIVPMMSIGAKGVISVVSNVYPKYIKDMVYSFEDGNIKKAMKMQLNMLELNKMMFVETNPIPVKRACNYLGICENELRLPLVPMSEENEKKLINTMLEFEKI